MITGINMPTPDPEYDEDTFILTEAEDEPIKEDEPITGSIYEYAFKRGNKEYQMYYIFDTDDLIVRYFSTNDYGVMVGSFEGNINTGFSIHWMEGWDESFKVVNDKKGILIDNDGFESEWKAAPVDEALAILNQNGYHDMELE